MPSEPGPSEGPGPITSPQTRITKRKLDDAFRRLDDAVGSLETLERPTKRSHITRSLYSTLAKYGIKERSGKSSSLQAPNNDLSKKTPHLTAIISRAASHTRKAVPFKFNPRTPSNTTSQHSTWEYRPSSIPEFLSRLATFKLATYANKPPEIDAVAAAKCGWINDGKDRLVCGMCNVSWVVGGRESMARDAANALIEKQKSSLIEMHKTGCPWKTRQCDSSIYRIPLQSPAVMAKKIKSDARSLESILNGIKIKHPLPSTQVQALSLALASFTIPVFESADSENPDETSSSTPTPQSEPSETSILVSLFGWAPCPVDPEPKTSIRPNSALRTVSTPFSSKPTSVSSSRAVTPTPGPPRPLIRMAARRDSSLLYCALCNRRVGLWAFTPQANPALLSTATPLGINGVTARQESQRHFDILKEHRSYCPYVVRSSVVPSLPVPYAPGSTPNISASSSNGQTGTVEGWRAVLTVVLRYGMGRRQQISLGNAVERQAREEGHSPSWTEPIDNVKSMVVGVKSRGGKELLKYIQGLLK